MDNKTKEQTTSSRGGTFKTSPPLRMEAAIHFVLLALVVLMPFNFLLDILELNFNFKLKF